MCATLRGRVAVDTEFHSERRHTPDLFLVQLQAEGQPTVLIDPRAVQDLRPLGAALSECVLLVHGGERDLQILVRVAGLMPSEVLDTQILAGCVGLGYPRRLEDLAECLFHTPATPSAVGLSDWSRRPFSAAQMAYAAADVAGLHRMTTALEARAQGQRLSWARGATREQVSRWLTPPDPLQAWRHIPAVRVLGHRERERLRVLAAWRANEARTRNLGLWNIASDRVLVDLARRAPSSLAILTANRLTPKGLVRRYGDQLLELVRGAPAAELRPLPTDAPALAAQDLIRAWAHGMEARNGVAASLLMPQWRLDTLLVDWQLGRPGDALPDWLEDCCGPELRNLLSGQLTMCLNPLAGASPHI